MRKIILLLMITFALGFYKTSYSQTKFFCASDSRGVKYQLELVEGVGTINAKTFSNTGSILNTLSGTWSVRDEGVYGSAVYLTAVFSNGSMKFLVVRDGSGSIQELQDVVANRKFYPCNNVNSSSSHSNIDDGSKYSWNQEKKSIAGKISVGNQVWSSENLTVKTFRNGDIIPQAKTNEEWARLGNENKPAWCYYNNDSIIGSKYGIIYNFYAVNDSRGLAPVGWRIPTSNDWTIFFKELGDIGSIYSREANGIKARNEWEISDITPDTKFSNTSGFTALPAGNRDINGNFDGIRKGAYWWDTDSNIWAIFYDSHQKKVFKNLNKSNGITVRVIEDR